jgi:REP element-mobilizing transposase RayT/CheY-like chemotaxis protein
LREHPQDVALVDFELPGRSGARVVQQLRVIQPDLAIIISPRQPEGEALLASLNVQGMADAPLSVRALIPLIERALSASSGEAQPASQTRRFEEPPSEPTATRGLDAEESEQMVQRQKGATQILQPDLSEAVENAPQTRQLDGESPFSSPSPGQTKQLGDEPPPPPTTGQRSRAGTRPLDTDAPPPPSTTPLQPGATRPLDDAPPAPPGRSPAATRPLDDVPPPPPSRRSPAATRPLDDAAPPAPGRPPTPGATRPLDDAPPPPARRQPSPGATRPLDRGDDLPKQPDTSKLDDLLQSFQYETYEEFEPPTGEGDTPSVPAIDSDAVRQYLATSSDPLNEGFDSILGEIHQLDPGDIEPAKATSEFDKLVRSLSGQDPDRPLPSRQQQQMDIILKGGMESVLREIEKAKTGPLEAPPKPVSALFQRLAQEEPPMPTLEESGTVSDLMMGVRDKSFQNVISLLQGDEPQDTTGAGKATSPSSEADAAFAAFFAPETGREQLPEEPEDIAQVRSYPKVSEPPGGFDFESVSAVPDEESTVAQVILQTTLDDAVLPPNYDQLMSTIEEKLSSFKIKIKPLPSWGMDTGVFRPISDAELKEPPFLPEEFPPELADSAASYTGRTTRPSATTLQSVDTAQGEASTAREQADHLDKTVPTTPPKVKPSRPRRPRSVPELPAEPEISRPETLTDLPAEPQIEEPLVTPTQTAAPTWLPDEEAPAYFQPPAEVQPALSVEDTLQQIEAEALADFFDDLTDLPVEEIEAIEQPEEDILDAVAEPISPFIDTDEDWPAAGSADWDVAVAEPTAEAEPVAELEAWEETPVPVTATTAPAAMGIAPPDDPYLAQLALNLTQMSLEKSVEGTLLSRDGEIIAFSGHLSPQDARELAQAVANDWEANPQGARLRFFTLPSSGKNYMLYSIRVTDALTLSLIVPGGVQISDLRKQSHRLVEALRAVPETPPEPVAEPEPVELAQLETALAVAAPAVPTTAYAFLWLVRDPNQQLSDAVAQAIMAGLKMQLGELGWILHDLQVHEDFVYLFADIPGDVPSHHLIRELKRRSALIASKQAADLSADTLWDDSYLILTPGRVLSTQEILDFINFQRM